VKEKKAVKYPGIPSSADGNTVAIMCERESTDGAGAYPITPSTQMGEYWAVEADNGHINVSGKPLIFIEPEGEHAAAAVTAGLAMTGLRATNFSSGQGIAYMHESLYAAVGKRLTYVLNVGCRAITKASLNVHAGHDDYHSVDDTGFFQLMAKNAQQVADLNIIAHRIAELALTPGLVGQDGFLTTHLIESLNIPERELIEEFLGTPADIIESPTPAQRMLYGERRRRIPELWSVDDPVLAGPVQNQDAYMQSVAAQRPYFFDHITELTEQAMEEFQQLTGRPYARVETYAVEDADYLIIGQGSLIPSAEVVADYLRQTRKLKVGVVNFTMFRPFPGDLLGPILKGKKGVAVLERTDQPLAEDLPLIREVRAALTKCIENGRSGQKDRYPEYDRFTKLEDMPLLYSGSYGLGSRDLQPEGLIGTIENMLPDGGQIKNFYLGVDFVHETAFTPKQEIHQQEILDSYPEVADLAVHGSENPNLLPENSITVRIHSVGGWGAMATGKNLTMTLADILGFYIKSNPKYGSEKKGQPTTYYLSVAPEPIKINCEYFFVDVVLAPDPNVFKHSNPLAGLKRGGIFIIQSDLPTPEEVWAYIPMRFQQEIVENDIHIYYLDAFKIAREEASDAELQYRMQGIAFQGAFFAVSHVRDAANLSEEALFAKIEAELQSKFGSKGARVVEDNLRVVKRGFAATHEITESSLVGEDEGAVALPSKLKLIPVSQSTSTDIHRFWEQTGYFYKTGKGNDVLADPFASLSLIPAATGVFKDMTFVRFDYPEFIPENCTGCGDCWVICPDSSLPGLVNEVGEVFESVIAKLEKNGHQIKHLRRSVRSLESKLRALIERDGEDSVVSTQLENAIDETLVFFNGSDEEKRELVQEYMLFKEVLAEFQFSVTRPFYTQREKESKGSGGLLSITLNPLTCKGCMECVAVCDDDALRTVPQTEAAIAIMNKNWDFWNELPNTKEKFIRIDDLDEGIGALETLLLNKDHYEAMVGGDGACLGCGEKTVMHLFTSTVAALLQPRVKKQLEKIDTLIEQLEQKIRKALSVEVSDTDQLQGALQSLEDGEFDLSDLNRKMDRDNTPVDAEWLKSVTDIVKGLKDLRWKYTEGITGQGRSNMGIVNATGCTSVWGSTYPINPYPFPWANHLFQDSPSVAMGLFEGHMQKMAEGFKYIRMAQHEIDSPAEELDLTYFTWKDFSDEEWLLCPPVVAVGGDGAMYDIGFQNLSRMLMSGKPIKTMVVDTQVYSNTGGQACTSGFIGQISDMATFGNVNQGKQEHRKEMGLIGFAHRTSYILQSSSASPPHLIEGFIEGLNSRRPALFNIYTACQPEHGIADDISYDQAKLALESRAYPFVRYNPDRGNMPSECFDLDGNPEIELDWPKYPLRYLDDDGKECSMELAMTFADFAASEARFRKHFKEAPRDTWDDETMIPIEEYLNLDDEGREDVFPFVWTINDEQQLRRTLMTQDIVDSTIERLNNWRLLKGLAGLDVEELDEASIADNVRSDMISRITGSLVRMATSDEDEDDSDSSSETKTLPIPNLEVGS